MKPSSSVLNMKRILFLLIFLMSSCKPNKGRTLSEPAQQQNSDVTSNNFTTPAPTEIIMTPAPTLTPAATITTTPSLCQRPSGNYDHLSINGHSLNHRTYEMLQYAAELYSGMLDITGDAITQGSYTNAVDASFGTHAGGGAVDLSVMAPGTYRVLEEDIDPLVRALRLAGFAAWYRDFDELYPGSPVHIHAIAIGDRELSIAAREQLAGPHGYFWGYNGLPVTPGLPIRDAHGGPIICDWMIDLGYPNKTATPSP